MLTIEPWSIVFILINLLVLYVIMRRVFVNPIKNIIEKRNSIIQNGLDNAAKSERNAKELEMQCKDKLSAAKEESARLIEKARVNAETEYSKIVDDANSEAARIINDARIVTERERGKAMEDMKKDIASIALDAAKKVLGNTDMSAVSSSLYEDFLTETGDEHDSNDN